MGKRADQGLFLGFGAFGPFHNGLWVRLKVRRKGVFAPFATGGGAPGLTSGLYWTAADAACSLDCSHKKPAFNKQRIGGYEALPPEFARCAADKRHFLKAR